MPHPPHTPPEEAVAAMIATYQRAVRARDVDAFVQQYDSDVRVFDTWGTWSYEGRAAWRRMIEGWFASLGTTEQVDVRVSDLRVIGSSAGMAVATAAFTYAAMTPEGRELRAMVNRLTWVIALQGSDWRIVHEHTSVPMDFEHAKGIFQRDAAR
jgi:uncharacterized protein (TIGR02246 family)